LSELKRYRPSALPAHGPLIPPSFPLCSGLVRYS